MKIRFIVLLIVVFLLIFIRNYEIEIKDNPKIISIYKNAEDNSSKIQEILKSEVIFDEIKIQRKDFNLLNIKNDFLFYTEVKPLELKHTKNTINIQNNMSFNFFNDFKIDLEQIWKNKKKFVRLDPDKIYFSGLLKEKNKIIAYLYFYENLITVSENDFLGDKKVLKIFKDGILLINEKNQFEVIM